MSDVGDAIELTYTTAPGATVTLDWIHTPTSTMLLHDQNVPEILEGSVHTGRYAITLIGAMPGIYEAVFTAAGTATNRESYYERFDPVSGSVPLTTLGEYTDLYGSLSAARASTARALIKRASQLIRDSYPGIDARIANGTVPASSVGLAVINMVARVLRNPGGLRSETTGPFSRSYDMEAASGMLEIADSDSALLVPPGDSTAGGGSAGRRMGSLRVTGGMVPRTHRRGWNNGPVFGPRH